MSNATVGLKSQQRVDDGPACLPAQKHPAVDRGLGAADIRISHHVVTASDDSARSVDLTRGLTSREQVAKSSSSSQAVIASRSNGAAWRGAPARCGRRVDRSGGGGSRQNHRDAQCRRFRRHPRSTYQSLGPMISMAARPSAPSRMAQTGIKNASCALRCRRRCGFRRGRRGG
jgi:hypothetical protein